MQGRLSPPLEDYPDAIFAYTPAHNAHKRSKRARQPAYDLVECVARLPSGQLAGVASWLSPIDRMSTGGYPLPEEKEEEDRWDEIFKEEGKSETELELNASMDLEFAGKFGDELDRVRREWSQGRRHWYLVSSEGVHPSGKMRRRRSAIADRICLACFCSLPVHRRGRPGNARSRNRIQAA